MKGVLVVTTNPGLGDIAAEEVAAAARAAGATVEGVTIAPKGRKGRAEVRFDGELPALRTAVPHLRSVHHVHRLLGRFTHEGLSDIAAWFADLRAPEITAATRFRITAKRRGQHDFGTVDLQRATGAAVHRATGLIVDLHDHDLDLRVEVRDAQVEVWVPWTSAPLSRRGERPYRPRTALGANVAWGLLALTEGPRAPQVVLDCCVGSGTVLSEAAVRYAEARLLGFDRYPEPVAGARENLTALGLSHRVELREGDARDLARLLPEASVDLLVTNPPFGVRLGPHLDFDRWYHRFLKGAARVVRRGGRLGVLVRERRAFNRALDRVEGLRLVHVRVLNTGNLWPALFVVARD